MSDFDAQPRKPVRPNHSNIIVNEEVAATVPEATWEIVDDEQILNGDDEVNDEDVFDENETPAEVEQIKIGHDPKLPTCAEIEDHRTAGHMDFRSWCIHCVRTRGLGAPHRAPDGVRQIAVLSLDYFFLTMGSVVAPGEEGLSRLDLEQRVEDGTAVKCLAMRDSRNKALFASVVPRKGRDDFVVSRVVEAVQWLGYS